MYELLLKNKSHLFAATVTSLSYSRYSTDYNHNSGFVITYNNSEITAYAPTAVIEERKVRAKNFFLQPPNVALYLKECQALKDFYQTFYRSLQKENFELKTNVELATLFRHLLNLQARCAALYQGTHEYAMAYFESELIKKIKVYSTNWEDVLQEIAVDSSPELVAEEKDFVLLIKNKNPDLRAHIFKYPWVCAKSFFFDEAEAELRHLLQARAPKAYFEQKTKQFSHLLDDPEITSLAQFLRSMGTLRIELKRLLSYKVNGSPLYTEIAKRLDIATRNIFYTYDADEILSILENGPKSVVTGTRVYVGQGNDYRVITGTDAEEWIKKVEVKNNETTLKGLAVSKGLVQGKVRVILPSLISELSKDGDFKEGDILVTTMTNPNMIFLMNRASGIITDEGGITCHAAVICRELDKPCIVGTRVATKILRDGDTVTLDASAGTIVKE